MNIRSEYPDGAAEDPTRPPMVVRVGRKDDGGLTIAAELGGISLPDAVASMLVVAIGCIESTGGAATCVRFWNEVHLRLTFVLEAINQHDGLHLDGRHHHG